MLDYLILSCRSMIRRHIRDERGAMAIEYIGLALLALALLGLLTSYLSEDKGKEIGETFLNKIKDLINKAGGTE